MTIEDAVLGIRMRKVKAVEFYAVLGHYMNVFGSWV